MANGVIIKEPKVYQKGDTISVTSRDYLYGLLFTTGNQVYLNLSLDRPIISGTPTISNLPTTIPMGTVVGKKDMTNINSTSVSIINGGLQIIIDGLYDTTGLPPTYSPVIAYATFDITLT